MPRKPPNPKLVKPEIPDSVVLLLGRMMAKLPIQRFQTPDELVTEIERIQELLGSEGSGHWVSAEAIFPGANTKRKILTGLKILCPCPCRLFRGWPIPHWVGVSPSFSPNPNPIPRSVPKGLA